MARRKALLEQICGFCDIPQTTGICNGVLANKSKETNKCIFDCLSEEQIDYIYSDIKSNVYLNACPGSGKTEVIGLKGAIEIKKWDEPNSGIAILTFTNSAEDEIRSRTVEYLGHQIDYPHFIGTFTSWLHGYVANPFLSLVTGYKNKETFDNSIKLIDSKCTSDFLFSFETKYKYHSLGNIKANEIYFDLKSKKYMYCGFESNGQSVLDGLLSQDKWREEELSALKSKFWKAGFALYEDVEYLSLNLLIKEENIATYIAKRFPVIFIDECQDLSFVELQILKCLNSHGCNIHIIGDLDQSIYGFRNIDPSDTNAFVSELSMDEMRLSQNHRSCSPIVESSMFVLNKKDKITSTQSQKLDRPLIAILYKKGEESQVVSKFESLVDVNGLNIKNSRIIVRNNNLRNKMYGSKDVSKSINTIEEFAKALYWHYNGCSVEDFQRSTQSLARAIQRAFFSESEHQNITYLYKPVEMESSEWRRCINDIKNALVSSMGLNNFDLTWEEWKKALQKALTSDCASKWNRGTLKLGKLRNNCAKQKVQIDIGSGRQAEFNCAIETIHSCKGMSLDAVLFMSAYSKSSSGENSQNNGSHWHSWFVDDSGIARESNRLAYVAFSRAKHLLVLGIPNPQTSPIDEEHKQLLIDAGFEIISVS